MDENTDIPSGTERSPSAELPALLAKEQLADYFDVAPRTIEAWLFENTGPIPIKIGKHLRWTVDSVRAFILEQEQNDA
ncbi:MAG: helix-turn-helix domain-containing protein [Microbacterium sp.]